MVSVIPLRSKKPKMSKIGTIFTIVNVYVNNTMLYNSYAFMKGGLVSIAIYGLICLYLCYCAKLMIRLVNNPKVPIAHRTLPGLAGEGYGWIGRIFVSLVIIIENFGRTMIGVITLWANVLFLLQYEIFGEQKVETIGMETMSHWIAVISTLCICPFVLMFAYLSDLYFGGLLVFISTSLLSILILLNFIAMGSIPWHLVRIVPANLHDLALAIGIFIANLAGHACLPSIHSQMENAKEYDSAVNVSWLIIFGIQVMTGMFGYLTFGDHTSFIITHSMIEYGGNHIMTVVLIGLLIMNLFFHIPIGVIISAELPSNALQIKHPLIRRIFHVIWFFVIASIAFLLVSNVAVLSSLMGSIFTLIISMLCPLLFKMHLEKSEMSKMKLWMLRIAAAIIVLFAGLLFYVNVLFGKSEATHKSKW